jgi:[acyl-carrier-protein] S-malonyltransferase
MVAKIAYLFPGQGSQSVGMGKSYIEKSAAARAVIEKADAVLGFGLSQIMFEGPEEKLRETDITQPALFTASAAALELLLEKNLQPYMLAGHSLGEYSALYAAGVISFEDGLKLVRARGQAMASAGKENPGTMAAIIGLSFEKIREICASVSSTGVCVPANYNSESQIVISGSIEAVKAAMDKCTAAGAAKVVALNVAGAFHSPLMKSAVEKMRPLIEQTEFKDARALVITNIDAKPVTRGNEFKNKLIEQIDHGVMWDPTLKGMNTAGVDTFIEVGSGRVLSTMAKKLDRKKNALCTDDMDGIEKALAATPAA